VSESISSLHDLGWRDPFARALEALGDATLSPARIMLQQRGRYTVATGGGELAVVLEGRFRKTAASAAELPCVGDWVAIRVPAPGVDAGMPTVCAVLRRSSKFSRKASGSDRTEQVLAANVDTIFIAMGLDGDFNLHRLERYLTVAAASGGRPVVLLTKADLCTGDQLAARVAAVQAMAPAVPVLATSVITDQDARVLDPFLGRGQTVVLLGSSGVGKSTLVNALLQQEVLRTGQVRPSDSRGRHTTTQRQLFRVRGGALVIDTPGIRELERWDAGADVELEASFADLEAVAAGCRFRDCHHHHEPGCAVTEAIARGELPPARLALFNGLRAPRPGRAPGVASKGARRR
jgi:ribosome biogenesis GTPase